jgi:hypothetical protein
VRSPVPAAPAALADAHQPAAPAVASPASPVRGAAGNEVEDANENVIVSPEEITASRRDGTNAKRRLSGDECIEGFDKNAVGFLHSLISARACFDSELVCR